MKVEIKPVKKENSKIKAHASVTYELSAGDVTINSVKIVEGENGLFVAMPRMSYEKDGEKKFSNLVWLGNDQYEKVTEAVLKAYADHKPGKKGDE